MKKMIAAVGVVLMLASFGCKKMEEQKKPLSKEDLKTQIDKVSYGIGMDMGRNFKRSEMDINAELFMKGLKDGLKGTDFLMTDEEFKTTMQAFQQEMMTKQQEKMKKEAEAEKVKGKAWLDENAKKEGVKVLPSGLQYKVIKEGTGEQPQPEDTVEVNYVGTLTDGTEFDSSIKRGQPAKFQLNRVIKGWTEGVGLMKKGAKYQLFIPSDLAYGDRAAGDKIKPGSTLVFEVDLLNIEKAPAGDKPATKK